MQAVRIDLIPGNATIVGSIAAQTIGRLVGPVRPENDRDSRPMHVEFLGVSRQRAGVAELEIQADTLGQLLTALVARFPGLADLLCADRLQPFAVANLNGDRFVTDPRTRLTETDCVLILSADAGG